MAHLDLRIREGCEEPYIEIYADAVNLGDQISESFGSEGWDDVLPWWGTDYQISETVLGQEVWASGMKGAIILACGCGCHSCSGVNVDVAVNDDTIVFSNFTTWRYGGSIRSSLEPITFDRKQYEDAVRLLHHRIQEWRPPTSPDEPLVEVKAIEWKGTPGS